MSPRNVIRIYSARTYTNNTKTLLLAHDQLKFCPLPFLYNNHCDFDRILGYGYLIAPENFVFCDNNADDNDKGLSMFTFQSLFCGFQII